MTDQKAFSKLAWYSSSLSSTRKLAKSEAGPETGLQLLLAHDSAHLWNCELYNWAIRAAAGAY